MRAASQASSASDGRAYVSVSRPTRPAYVAALLSAGMLAGGVCRYVSWPLSVRTGLFIAGRYLRRVAIASDAHLFAADDYSRLSNSLSQPVFVTAFNIDDALMRRPTTQKRNTAAQLLLGTCS